MDQHNKNQDQSQTPSPSKRRREREKQELADRILEVAREMFVRDGYEAVTLNRIADAIEYSPATIYQHFKDKRSLVMSIIRTDYEDVRCRLLKCMEISDPIARLTKMARVYAQWGVEHPNHYRLLNVPPPAWEESGRELREELNPPVDEDLVYMLRSFVDEALATGLVRDRYANPALVATTLWAGVHGVVMQEITMDQESRALVGVAEISFEIRVHMLISVFLDGFLKPGVLEGGDEFYSPDQDLGQLRRVRKLRGIDQ